MKYFYITKKLLPRNSKVISPKKLDGGVFIGQQIESCSLLVQLPVSLSLNYGNTRKTNLD